MKTLCKMTKSGILVSLSILRNCVAESEPPQFSRTGRLAHPDLIVCSHNYWLGNLGERGCAVDMKTYNKKHGGEENDGSNGHGGHD